MAYEKQTWAPFQEGGTIITADALNHMEAGIDDAHTAVAATSSSLSSLRSTHSSDISSLEAVDTATTARLTTAEGDIDSLDGRVSALESTPASASRLCHLTFNGFIYGSSATGTRYNYIYNTVGWHVCRWSCDDDATANGMTAWDGDDTLTTYYGSGFTIPEDCNGAVVYAAFASNDSGASTEGRRCLQLFTADKDRNPTGVGGSVVAYNHEDTYGDRPAFTVVCDPGARVSIAVKWPVQHATPTSGVWGGYARVVLL